MKLRKDVLAKMEYLDDDLARYKNGYPSLNTKRYYETLISIRDAQLKGEIPPDSLYLDLGLTTKTKGGDSLEYGYYTSNIHYYLFIEDKSRCKEYKEELNSRVRYLLENGDQRSLTSFGWFPLNFPVNYLRFLSRAYNVPLEEKEAESSAISDATSLNEFVYKYGNSLERLIGDISMVIAYSYMGLA